MSTPTHQGRPFVLDPIFRTITSLPGIGPRMAKLVSRVAGEKVVDLIWTLPVNVIDRRFSPDIAKTPPGRVVTLSVRVDKHIPGRSRRQPYRVQCSDNTGQIDLVFFHAKGDYLAKQLPLGEERVVSGKVDYFHGHPQMAHPDVIVKPEEKSQIQTVEPVYPLTEGLSAKVMRRAVHAAVQNAPQLPEWLDASLLKQEHWPSWHEALVCVHAPESESALTPFTPARRRLAYDEFLANQLAIALVRQNQRSKGGRPLHGDGHLRDKALKALPFDLTGAQKAALDEIYADMMKPTRMLRLLQGDVGSGKTVVALMAMLNAVECGCQAAIMAPTEILARQHEQTIAPLAEAAGVKTVILTGRDKGKTRTEILQQIESGEAQIVIGTHALFQESVKYADLGLAVVDEQHRFGVHQRLQLTAKGKGVDMLVMTATPIPRTLTLTAYGDMDVSRLTEKPPGRQPIDTVLVSDDRLGEVVEGLKRKIATGARIYWVCPLVEESEQLDLAAAEDRYAKLKAVFGSRIGLVHGRMKPAEKDHVMQQFADGAIDILVATTVIEVGVNVPEATVMIIEHAQRFGLSQLHQLRGRIGRGADKSTCILLYGHPLSETARERLQTMRKTEDGFEIAEMDLKLRGAGEILGTRQSGMPDFKVADLAAHDDLIAMSRDDARLIIDKDPELKSERGKALRVLLYLFERDAAIKYLRSG